MPAIDLLAPTGGLNARDPLDLMAAQDALVLDNIFPTPSDVMVRRGYQVAAELETSTAPIDTLMEYMRPTGIRELLAASYDGVEGTVYFIADANDATSFFSPVVTPLATTMVELKTGFNGSQWVNTNFNDKLFMANGVDTPQIWDGTSLEDVTFTGPPDLTKLTFVESYKNRLYFAEGSSLWYGEVNAIAGALVEFNVGGQLKLGGYIQLIASWSQDTGAGLSDIFVIISNQGEVLIYEGLDPEDTDSPWRISGRFYVPKALFNRADVRMGADIALITKAGVVSLQQVFSGAALTAESFVSNKIQNIFNTKAEEFSRTEGWEGLSYNRGSYVLFNVPTTHSAGELMFEQYVMNSLTGSWCRFKIDKARCWGLFDKRLYFGGTDGKVYLADVGTTDDGEAIKTKIKTSYQYLGDREHIKQFTLVKPSIYASNAVKMSVEVDVDFQTREKDQTVETVGVSGTFWDQELWDEGVWAGDFLYINDYYSVTGLGKSVSVLLNADLLGVEFRLTSISLIYKVGGIL